MNTSAVIARHDVRLKTSRKKLQIAGLVVATLLAFLQTQTQVLAQQKQSPETQEGIAAHKAWNWSKAITCFDKAIANDPDDFIAHFYRAWDLCLAGKSDKAIEDCNVCVRLAPNDAASYNNRAVNYFVAGNYQKAVSDANQALETSHWREEFDPFTVILLYLCERRQGHIDKAQAALANGDIKCSSKAWSFNLIRLYQGKTTEDELLKTSTDDPTKTSVKVYSGLLYLANGDRKKARKNFRWAISSGVPEGTGWDLALCELRHMEGIDPGSIEEAKSMVEGD